MDSNTPKKSETTSSAEEAVNNAAGVRSARMATLLAAAESTSSSSSASIIEETPEFLKRAVQQFDEAVQLLPAEDTSAYHTAVAQCPALVAREAHPVGFLRCCDWNPWGAAARCMNYWRARLEVYGAERCFRSIFDLSGNGALDEQAIRIAEAGAFYALQLDAQGRNPVFLFDRTKFSPRVQRKWNVSLDDKKRAIFYLFHVPVLQQPHASRDGVVLVHLVTTKDPKVYPGVNSFVSRVIKDCFPFRLSAFHMVLAPSLQKQKHSKFACKIVPFLQQMTERCLYFASVKTFHVALFDSNAGKKAHQESLAAIFRKIGVREEAMPPEAGGKWSHSRYKRWLNELQKEQAATLASIPPLTTATAMVVASSNIIVVNDLEDEKTSAGQKKRRHEKGDLESMPLAKALR